MNCSTIEMMMQTDDRISLVRENLQTHLDSDASFPFDLAVLTSSSHSLWNLSALKHASSLSDSWYRSFAVRPDRNAFTILEFNQSTVMYLQHPEPTVSTGNTFPSLKNRTCLTCQFLLYVNPNIQQNPCFKIKNGLTWAKPSMVTQNWGHACTFLVLALILLILPNL